MPPPYGPPVAAVPDEAYCLPCLHTVVQRIYQDVPGSLPARCHRCDTNFGPGVPRMAVPGVPGHYECGECWTDLWGRSPLHSPTTLSSLVDWQAERERGYRLRLQLSQLRNQQETLNRQLEQRSASTGMNSILAPNTRPPT